MNIDTMPIANAIELLTIFSPEIFDEVYKADAYASRLSTDKRMLQFTGTKTVRIPKAAWGGLYDYNRPNVADARVNGSTPYGYQASNVGLAWEDFTLTQDRGAFWPIEHFDNEESGGVILGRSLTQLNRTVFVPEIDKYLFSKIYDYAGKKVDAPFETATVSSTGLTSFLCLRALNDAEYYVSNQEVPEENQILFCSTAFDKAMKEDTAELPRWIQQADYKKDISFKVAEYDGREVVIVVPQRFKTGFIPGPGHDNWAQDSKPIDFILMPKDAAIHVVKYQKVMILEGREALLFTHMDGYVIIGRIYHDVFVQDNKRVAIYAHTGGFSGISADNPNYAEAQSLVAGAAEACKLNGEVTVIGNRVSRTVFRPADKIITLLRFNGNSQPALKTAIDSLVGGSIGTKAVTLTIGANSYEGSQVGIGDVLETGDVLYALFGGQLVAKITNINGANPAVTSWTEVADETILSVIEIKEA